MRKFVAPEIVFGAGALNLIGQYARNLSGRKVLLVSDKGVEEAGWAKIAEDGLISEGLAVEYYDQILPNPRVEEVMAGADKYLVTGCDLIVAVGGGSAMDCAKAIGAVHANQCHVLEFEGVDMVPVPGPPLICVPTTAGSSADVSQFAIINDVRSRRKFAIISKSIVPDISLIDPVTTSTMDKMLTVETGLDALSHAFESYVSNASSPLTDLYALEAARLLSSYLPLVIDDPHDLEIRDQIMLGALYSGLAFSNASLGLTHAMAHGLGGYYNAIHGESNAILLEKVVKFNYSAAPEKYNDLARAVSADSRDALDADSLVRKLKDLRTTLGLDWGLSNMGMRLEDIPDLSRAAFMDPCLATNPREVRLKDIEELYESAI